MDNVYKKITIYLIDKKGIVRWNKDNPFFIVSVFAPESIFIIVKNVSDKKHAVDV